jgi:hypothetical protein
MAHSETSHRDALAESFSRRAEEPDGFHLSFHEIHSPKPKRNFLACLTVLLSTLFNFMRAIL